MSMDILRATKLKYGAIHSADPKPMYLNFYSFFLIFCAVKSVPLPVPGAGTVLVCILTAQKVRKNK